MLGESRRILFRGWLLAVGPTKLQLQRQELAECHAELGVLESAEEFLDPRAIAAGPHGFETIAEAVNAEDARRRYPGIPLGLGGHDRVSVLQSDGIA